MRWRAKIVLGFLALAIIGAVFLFAGGNRAQKDLEAARLSLRQQGFKVDVREFDLSTPPEIKNRTALLATTTRAGLTNRGDRFAAWRNLSALPANLAPVGKDAALITWRQARLRSYDNQDVWAQVRESVNGTNRAAVQAALQAAISGPIRFEPIGSGPRALMPYLAELKQLENTFRAQTLLALRDGRKHDAWTNLLAATCLVTEYTPEPIDISHLVRVACATIALDLTWNALQADPWTDAQLAELQRHWESADFWRGLPETSALARANNSVAFEMDRNEPLRPGMAFRDVFHAPRAVAASLVYYWKGARYRHKGSYEDEKTMLLYFRDRELDLKRAVQAKTWSEMRQLPGVTNTTPFSSTNSSRIISMLNLRQMGVGVQMRGGGLLGRIAEAEARRRLIVTALAIERYHIRHGSYPESLPQVLAEFPSVAATDFMDGQPLRYRRAPEGRFVLYSVGLDCVDNGGEMRRPSQRRTWPGARPDLNYSADYPLGVGVGSADGQGLDLVWPRPASDSEADRLRQEQIKAEAAQLVEAEEREADDQWERTARRMAKVQSRNPALLLATTKEPPYRGRPLGDWLQNEQTAGTNKLSLPELLTLHRQVTGSDPEIVTFELPIKYEAVTNVGELQLHVDPVKDEDSYEDCEAGLVECKRATNGNCLLAWSTIYEAPGKHAVRAALLWQGTNPRDESLGSHLILGPVSWFTVTNLCQFSVGSAHFNPEHGVTIRAKLAESNGVYSAEMRSPAGDLLKTLDGTTTDGIIECFWDLKDERGHTCTNEFYDTVFEIKLPVSGRAQRLKGP